MAKFNTRPPLTMAPQQITNQTNSTFVEKLVIGLEHAPQAFNLREQIIGAGGANLHYIRNETGAIATLRGRGSMFVDPVLSTENPEPLHLYIEHQRFDGLQTAKQLAKNLIETLQQEVYHLQQSNQNTPNVAFSNSGAIIQQSQPIAQISVPPPMLAVPPPIIQQNLIDQPGNQETILQQNFLQQNVPPVCSQTIQSQQQTVIHQQIIPQTVPIQLQQSNVVIQQPVQQHPSLGNINIPPPGIPIPIKTGPIVQFQTPPPPPPPVAPHLSQPPPNIQLQHQSSAGATQIVLNHPQNYQYQYIQQPIQTSDSQLRPNQVTIQHIYQPHQQLQGIVQQTPPQSQVSSFEQFQQVRSHQLQNIPPQQYITVQGNTAYMVPPPTIIHQQPTSQHNSHTQVQTQIATSNPNILFQPPPQLQQLQMQMTQGISVQNIAPLLPANSSTRQENVNQISTCDENANNSVVKVEQKLDGDQLDRPSQKSPDKKTEGDAQSSDSSDICTQTSSTTIPTMTIALPPPPQPQTISIRQPPPTIRTSITLPVTQMPPPTIAVPPPMSCVQHFVGNTLISTQPATQSQTHHLYNQVPLSIQQIPSSSQQIHVSTTNGQHFLVNTTPQWQGGSPSAATLTQQPPIHQLTQNGAIQNVQITHHQIAHNGADFRAIPPPTLNGQTNPNQTTQQTPVAMTFNPHVQVQFQPQLLQQLPPSHTIDSTQIISGQVAGHPNHQFNVVQQQPHLSFQQTVISPFQEQIKKNQYQEQNRSGQKRKHDEDDPPAFNQQPRTGMGQRDQNQPMHQQQQPQSLHQPPRTMPPSSLQCNLSAQSMTGSSNNSANSGQDETAGQQLQSDIQNQLGQPPPQSPTSSGIFSDNRPFFQREINESLMDGSSRQSFDGPPLNVMRLMTPGNIRGQRFHHNNVIMGQGSGFSMRPPFHLHGNDSNFPMHRVNFGPPPPPPPYRDCLPNVNGGYGPLPPRFRGQW